jgi:Lrp/AsnC family transcriptional regulator, regulator for asnA, asnC and gidA
MVDLPGSRFGTLPRFVPGVGPVSDLDTVDRQIIQAFRFGGRLTNAQVAREVGVSEGTVRRRIELLVKAGVLNFVAITDPRKIGLMVDTLIGISTNVDRIDEIAEELAEMPEVRYVGIAMGAFDIWVGALFPTVEDWMEFRSTRLAQVKGIRRTETFQITKVLKRTYDWVTPDGDSPIDTRLGSTLKGGER